MGFMSNTAFALKSTGIVTSLLAIDIGLLVLILFVSKNLLIPVASSFKTAKSLDALAGAAPRHWFYGHAKQEPSTEAGIMRRAKRSLDFPTMYNQWMAPFLSVLHFHHPDTAVSLLSSGAPKSYQYDFIRPWIGDGLLTSKGSKWRRNRHLLTPAFHFSVLKGYTQVFNCCSKIMFHKWQKNLGKPLDVYEDVSLMTLDTMLKCAMSSDTDCQHVKERHPYINAVKDLAHETIYRTKHPHLLLDVIFWNTKHGKRFQSAMDTVHEHAEKIIFERRAKLEKTGNFTAPGSSRDWKADDSFTSGKNRLDFLDILLQTKDQDGNGLSDREIRDEVDTFLFEGHDTTASGISWAIYNLAKYPDLQEKCRAEVNNVLGGKEDIDWSDFSKLQYLTMFIKESLRLYPPVYFISRKLDEPLTLRSLLNKAYELVVPKGSSVGLHIFALHRNSLVWENVEKFDPDRFTKENVSKRNPHAFLPFSAGSRNCIGQNFAMNEMKTTLAQLLQRYRVYLDEETPKPEIAPRLTLQSKNGILVKLEKLPQ